MSTNIVLTATTLVAAAMTASIPGSVSTHVLLATIQKLLRTRRRILSTKMMANPWYMMLVLTVSICMWIGRIRKRNASSTLVPPRGKDIPRLNTLFGAVGVAYQYLKAKTQGRELPWIYRIVQEQGPTLTTKTYGHCLILAFEPSSVQHVLVKIFENYPKGKELQ